MNAFTSVAAPALPCEPFDAAIVQFDTWRGRCLDAFVRAEAAVTETLLSLRNVQGRGGTVQMPHLVGQRYAALATAIGPTGEFAPEGRKACAMLEEFQAHTRLRTMLCHGVGDILLDRHGRWTVVLRNVSLRAHEAERDSLLLSQDEAELLHASVARMGQSLCAQLGQVRAAVAKASA